MAIYKMTPEDAGKADVTLEKTVREGNEGKDPVAQALPQIEAAQNATQGQIAATNAAQADAAVAAQMQPINQTIDFLNLYNQRQEAEYAKEKEQEQKRINRERLGHDIASLAASVGDMVRASEGAPVSPRDWQQTYDNLSAQAKANIDNYRVRMAKLHEDEKAARMAQAQAKAKAIGDKQKQDYDIKKLMLELGWKGDQASFERALKIFLNERDNDTKVNIANIRSKSGGGSRQSKTNVTSFGKTFTIPVSARDDAMLEAAGKLEKANVSLGLKEDITGVERIAKARIIVSMLMQTPGEIEKDAKGNDIIVYHLPANIEGTGNDATTIALTEDQVKDIQSVFERASKLADISGDGEDGKETVDGF